MSVQAHNCHPERIAGFLNRSVSDSELAALEDHLAECAACQKLLGDQTAASELWEKASRYLRDEREEPDPLSGASDLSPAQDRSHAIQAVLKSLRPTDDPEMLGRLGGLEVGGVVGAGAMGVVLKAFDHSLDRTVAVKVLAPHLASSGGARKRFAREAKAAAAVLHPNVMAIHSVSNDESLPYLVMPYYRGVSLQKRLDREGPLPLSEILRIGMQIAAGLAAAHAQGLIHRDIKPANILLEEGVERVAITDFGLARAVDDAAMTRTGVIAGTPQYMSPEQARGDAVDQRSDLFSLGSVLYAMCTGRSPFRAETSYGVLRRITDEEPRPIREINPEIPEWFEAIIQRLHAKHPQERFQSAAEFADLLEDCLAHVQQPTAVPLPDRICVQKQGAISTDRTTELGKGFFVMMAAVAAGLLGLLVWQSADPPETSDGIAAQRPSGEAPAPSAAAAADAPEESKLVRQAADRLAGVWRLEGLTYNGKERGGLKTGRLTFRGNRVQIALMNPGNEGALQERQFRYFSVNPAKSPAEINLYDTNFLVQGIYELEGDELTLALYSRPEIGRPGSFAAADAQPHGQTLAVMRFRKQDGAASAARSDAVAAGGGNAITARTFEITGVVVSEQKEPLADADVRLLETYTYSEEQHARTRTDRDGRFVIKDIPQDQEGLWRYTLAVSAASFASRVVFVPFAPKEPVHFELELSPPAALRGRVVDADGHPVGGAMLWTPPLKEPIQGLFTAATDADGYFQFVDLARWSSSMAASDGLGDGKHLLRVHHPKYGKKLAPYAQVPASISIVLDLPMRLTGQVFDSHSGFPVAGAAVRAGYVEAVTGAKGRYQLTVQPLEELSVQAEWKGAKSQSIDLTGKPGAAALLADLYLRAPGPGGQGDSTPRTQDAEQANAEKNSVPDEREDHKVKLRESFLSRFGDAAFSADVRRRDPDSISQFVDISPDEKLAVTIRNMDEFYICSVWERGSGRLKGESSRRGTAATVRFSGRGTVVGVHKFLANEIDVFSVPTARFLRTLPTSRSKPWQSTLNESIGETDGGDARGQDSRDPDDSQQAASETPYQRQLLLSGKVRSDFPERPATLGVGMHGDGRAVTIRRVRPGTGAEEAGLREGDRILAIDGHTVSEPQEVVDRIIWRHPGDQATLLILRGDELMTVRVTVTEFQSSTRHSQP